MKKCHPPYPLKGLTWNLKMAQWFLLEPIIFRNSIFNLGECNPWVPSPGPLQGSLRNLEATHPSKPRKTFPEPTERWHCPSGSMVWWKTWDKERHSTAWVVFYRWWPNPVPVSFELNTPGDTWGGSQHTTTFERGHDLYNHPTKGHKELPGRCFLLLVDKREADTTRSERIDG